MVVIGLVILLFPFLKNQEILDFSLLVMSQHMRLPVIFPDPSGAMAKMFYDYYPLAAIKTCLYSPDYIWAG